MLVLVNGAANGGRGAARWARVEPALRGRGLAFEARRTASAEEAAALVAGAAAAGHRSVVAAGGDGTMNGVLNALMDPATDRPRADLALGAIGLGSSNDFHKPLRPDALVEGVPVRVDEGGARALDVGRAVLTGADGSVRTRYFLLNASLGLVAEGNAFFNGTGPLLRRLKRLHVEAAILYAALVNVLRFRPLALTLALDGEPALALEATNVGVLKRVHFAGGMRYDTPVQPDDGLFDVNVWGRQGRVGIARTVAQLYRGRFEGLAVARCRRARAVSLRPAAPAQLELDGEVGPVASAELTVLPGVLRVCG